MGDRASSTICLGVRVEGENVPWKDCDDGEEEWWRSETGFVRQGPELYTPDGNSYLGGAEPSEEAFAAYFAEPREWSEVHPLPVQIVRTGSGYDGDTDEIIAVPGTVKSTDWDEPIEFDPVAMVGKLYTDLELAAAYTRFRMFQAKYKILGQPAWLLSSYWG